SHKITHFLDYIRNTMHLTTSNIDDIFIKNLAARSNNTVSDTQTLFNHISALNSKSVVDKTELERLNTLIEQFKSHNQWKKKQ
ncbi:DUF4350 domain-containing protein, partial [bacterium]|nr:DUF4350 domain-containing protein [bacterium]